MKTMFKRFIPLMLCLLLITGCAAAEDAELVESDQPLPNVTEIYGQYTTLDLTPYLGKTVLINFFTEWCVYCMEEMPDLKAVDEMYDDDAFQTIFVHVWDGEDERNTESVKARFGLENMTFFEDKDFAVSSVTGLQGYPATIIVSPEGELLFGANSMMTQDMLVSVLDTFGVPRAQEGN